VIIACKSDEIKLGCYPDWVTKSSTIRILFIASATVFFTRAMLWSTWQSRGPEVQSLLHLNTAQMGLLVLLYPVGGIVGLAFSDYLSKLFGSTRITVVGFAVASASMAGLAFSVPAGNVWVSAILLVLMGFPMGVEEFIGNLEANSVDRQSSKSLIPAIHSIFGVGMMLAALLASVLAANQVNLTVNYLLVAVAVAIPSVWAGLAFPKREFTLTSPEAKRQQARNSRVVWTERRTQLVALVGFSFVMAESTAGTWVPISLSSSGYSASAAAAALGLFWITVTGTRAIGGFIVDRIGRHRTIQFSGITASLGILLFILNDWLHVPYLAIFIWAAGMANGFPLSINSMSSNSVRSPARVSMLILVAYGSIFTVGPALGAVGQWVGIGFALAIPIFFLLLGSVLSKNAKEEAVVQ
jgi:MFS family permease